jgi:hypothetical protein
MKFLVIIFSVFLSLPTFAGDLYTTPVSIHCRVEKVLDGGSFELKHKFSFSQYPYLAYTNNGKGRLSLLIGGIEYSTEGSYLDYAYTFQLSVDGLGIVTVAAYSEENRDDVSFMYNGQDLLATYKGKRIASCRY